MLLFTLILGPPMKMQWNFFSEQNIRTQYYTLHEVISSTKNSITDYSHIYYTLSCCLLAARKTFVYVDQKSLSKALKSIIYRSNPQELGLLQLLLVLILGASGKHLSYILLDMTERSLFYVYLLIVCSILSMITATAG